MERLASNTNQTGSEAEDHGGYSGFAAASFLLGAGSAVFQESVRVAVQRPSWIDLLVGFLDARTCGLGQGAQRLDVLLVGGVISREGRAGGAAELRVVVGTVKL